jgi:hypothetical protein
MEHWNYSGLPPVERYNEAVDRANELLEALKGFIDGECHCDEVAAGAPCVQCVAAAAIAKAEGR